MGSHRNGCICPNDAWASRVLSSYLANCLVVDYSENSSAIGSEFFRVSCSRVCHLWCHWDWSTTPSWIQWTAHSGDWPASKHCNVSSGGSFFRVDIKSGKQFGWFCMFGSLYRSYPRKEAQIKRINVKKIPNHNKQCYWLMLLLGINVVWRFCLISWPPVSRISQEQFDLESPSFTVTFTLT